MLGEQFMSAAIICIDQSFIVTNFVVSCLASIFGLSYLKMKIISCKNGKAANWARQAFVNDWVPIVKYSDKDLGAWKIKDKCEMSHRVECYHYICPLAYHSKNPAQLQLTRVLLVQLRSRKMIMMLICTGMIIQRAVWEMQSEACNLG